MWVDHLTSFSNELARLLNEQGIHAEYDPNVSWVEVRDRISGLCLDVFVLQYGGRRSSQDVDDVSVKLEYMAWVMVDGNEVGLTAHVSPAFIPDSLPEAARWVKMLYRELAQKAASLRADSLESLKGELEAD